MADEAKEFSREEAQSLMFHGAPQQPMTAPAVQSASNIPVPPPVAVIPGAKKAPVAKEPDAMGLVQKVSKANKELQNSIEAPKPPSSIGGLVDDITANWKPIAIGALTFATGYGAARLLGGRKSAEVSEGKPQSKGPAARIEPTFATPEETAAFKPVEQPTAPSKLALESEAKFGVPLSDVENHFGVKVTNIKDAEILSNNYKNSLPGAVSNQPAGIPGTVSPMNQLTGQTTTPAPVNAAPADLALKLGGQIGQFNPANIGQPLQDPLAGRGYQTPVQEIGPRQPVPPSISDTVATGGNVTKAVNQTIANLVDEKPMGMRENYKSNKAEPIGPGAFNHLANNVGAEKAAEIWKDVYGEKNVPYKQYMEKYSQEAGKNMYGPVVPLPEGAKPGGSFGTPKYIPEFIKGGASIGGMAGAAVIPALVAAGVQSYKGNKKAVDAELKDAWNSLKSVVTMPIDVVKSAGKGDFGPFKDMLMSMNPGTLLMNEMNKRDEPAIQRMIQAEKVGAGRGIAPPSAYFR